MMKCKWLKTGLMILTMGILCLPALAREGADSSLPLYKKFPFIPSFKLTKTDSSSFIMKDMVPKKSAAVVIVFSPLCSHCQHQAEEITSHMKDLGDVTFLFATTHPLSELQQYINDYGLDKFPNIYVGQDGGAMLGNFYKIHGIPGVYVYNKKGNLTAEFNTNIKADALLKALKM